MGHLKVWLKGAGLTAPQFLYSFFFLCLKCVNYDYKDLGDCMHWRRGETSNVLDIFDLFQLYFFLLN